MIKDTSIPMYPSIGKSIQIERRSDSATQLELNTSLNASEEEAFRAEDFIAFLWSY